MKHLMGLDDDNETRRDFTVEAHAIIRGTTMLRPTRMHLMALKYEISELEAAIEIYKAAAKQERVTQ